ncbi:fructosamine kinase family protein [Corynebacterium lubricantis]|uniref:fructosamine kinase family protein n=1 Tax=Corynebacterium lubricantis TaxID=541095 RepID=UPI000375D2C8|nr:fructosamine kinase family protein [Corynebacterium lubricantis]
MDSTTFIKKGSSPQSAAAEAAGLRWLRQASDRVVQVIGLDELANTLTLKRLDRARPTAEAAKWTGAELAKIHAAGAPAFGSPPEDWEGPNFIGKVRQECTPTNRWAVFYTKQRVLPFAEAAAKNGTLSEEGLALVRTACDAIEREDADAEVARIHGDLWSGNLMFSPDGPHFIDPSAHGGHAHTDLAMLSLFGVSHFEELVEGYETVTPLEPDWQERIPIHQLHPLAVHTLTHGSGYARELEKVATATIALLG